MCFSVVGKLHFTAHLEERDGRPATCVAAVARQIPPGLERALSWSTAFCVRPTRYGLTDNTLRLDAAVTPQAAECNPDVRSVRSGIPLNARARRRELPPARLELVSAGRPRRAQLETERRMTSGIAERALPTRDVPRSGTIQSVGRSALLVSVRTHTRDAWTHSLFTLSFHERNCSRRRFVSHFAFIVADNRLRRKVERFCWWDRGNWLL